MKTTTGDLVEDGWLPAVGLDGVVAQPGMLRVLTDAHTVRRLDLPVATMVPAVLRQLLLPVVLDALGAPRTRREWAGRFAQGRFSPDECERLTDYLTVRYGRRFRLFDGERPFGQVAGLQSLSGEAKSSTLLVPSIASGNNVPLFSAFSEADHLDLTVTQAALWLLHAQCWDTAAIKTGAVGDPQAKAGKTTGNPTGPLGQLGVIVPTGRTLYETLMLNSPILSDGLDAADRPQWAWDERPTTPGWVSPAGPQWSARNAGGLLDLLTFQSRRIRLIGRESGQEQRVRHVIVCAGDRLTGTPESEPHTAWHHTARPKAEQAPRRPHRHRSGRTAWQGLGSLLALAVPDDGPRTSLLLRQIGELRADGALAADYPLGVEISALEYGNQSAVVENAIADILPLPTVALVASDDRLRATLLECVNQADRVGRALDDLHADLRRAAGGEILPRDRSEQPSARLLHGVDPAMRRLLSGLRTIGDEYGVLEHAQKAWELTLFEAAAREAELLREAVPPRAVVGRVDRTGGKELVFRSGKATAMFRTRLKRILRRAADAQSNQRENNQRESAA
ncbi:type I-E CRISPR-associated protein Cse1/CasA [Streptomyces sp. 2A115]|uniref:type I-E CRISPR-associated protein Cse1/CasA n=1 Tax=Streptomyces sp. 2A115 TaxID=3457439 RepID=UPI003FD1E5C8